MPTHRGGGALLLLCGLVVLVALSISILAVL